MWLYWYVQGLLLIVLVAILTPLLGRYMLAVFSDKDYLLHRWLGWLEIGIYRLTGVDPTEDMSWKRYLGAVLWLNVFGFLFILGLQLLQEYLPLNPQHLEGVPLDLAINTSVSFVTNTNWQAYAGETTLSYLTQMVGMTVQNFLSAATGIAVLLALVRGLKAREKRGLGNFWVDTVRAVVYLLLPLSLVLAVVLVGEGVVQSLGPYVQATTLEGQAQTLPLGPAASQVAIKQLGTNGGGFFNANSAHPFENPTPFSNFLEVLAIPLLPAALTYTYGGMVASRRQGWMVFIAMAVLWAIGLCIVQAAESQYNPVMGAYPNFEGKELRLGILNSDFWVNTTTATANGSVNASHSSLTPLAGGMAMLNIMLGEHIFGGIGVGLCSMLMFVLLTVFLAGLMVGRTPEFLGKKIEQYEILWVIVAILVPCFTTLTGASLAVITPAALASLGNSGPHGLSEILYAFASASGNNGSAFASLNANTPFYNLFLALAMLICRLAIIVPSLAIAGSLSAKVIAPPSLGTFKTDHWVFGCLLISVIFIVGALTYFPALALGPIVEHFLMLRGDAF